MFLPERWGGSYVTLIAYNLLQERCNHDLFRVNYLPKVIAAISMASLDPIGSNFVTET
jgi:hypothetical protein